MALTEEEFDEALEQGLGYLEWRKLYEKHFGEPVPYPLENSWGQQPIDMVIDAIDQNKKLTPVREVSGEY